MAINRLVQQKIYPQSSYRAQSSYLRYALQCAQSYVATTDTIPTLTAGGVAGSVVTPHASIATGFFNVAAGYVGVGGAGNNNGTLPAAAHDVSLVDTSLIFVIRLKKTLPAFPASAAVGTILASTTSVSSAQGGIILQCQTTGRLMLSLIAAGSGTQPTDSLFTSAAKPLVDGISTPVERQYVFYMPRNSATTFSSCDGVESANTSNTANVFGRSLAGGNDMCIGGTLVGGTIEGFQISQFDCYAVPFDSSALTSSSTAMSQSTRRRIWDWTFKNPGAVVPDWVFAPS